MEKLSELYYTPRLLSSLGGINRMYSEARSGGLSRDDVQQWLSTQNPYTLHRSARRNCPKNKYEMSGTDDLWQADIADMLVLSRWNDGYKYLLVVVYGFFKYSWVEPQEDKKATTTKQALATILARAAPRKPNFAQASVKRTRTVNKKRTKKRKRSVKKVVYKRSAKKRIYKRGGVTSGDEQALEVE